MKFSKLNHSLSQHFGKHHTTLRWMVSKTKIFTLLTILISFSSFSQQTYVPDDNFEQALIDLGYDTVLDDYVTTANISGVTHLYINNMDIADLTGIEDFAALETLDCSDNYLGILDFSNNTQLTKLICENSGIGELNISQNTLLTSLECYGNSLWVLDVSANLALEHLSCSNNQMSTLTLGNNSALTFLSCTDNSLSNLDVSQCTALERLFCYSNAGIESLNLIHNAALQVLDCHQTSIGYLDLSHNTQLIALYAQDGSIGNLSHINIKNGNNMNMTDFDVTGNANLTCVQVDDETYATTNWTNIDAQTSFSEDCAFNETYVPDNNFEQALIDLGYDTVLDDYVTTANISGVINLDVSSKNIANLTGIEDFAGLKYFTCNDNDLTSLDLTQNTALLTLRCYNNQLINLDVSQNTGLTFLNCNTNLLTSLDLTQNTALTYLNCYHNELTSLNVTQNTELTYFVCSHNQITSLDVTQNTALTELGCNENELTTIDVTQIPDLVTLNVFNNHLASLDVTQNVVLDDLDCSFNELTSLDVTQNTVLTLLSCRINQIPSLDVTQNTALIELPCDNNQLTSLDVSQNTALTYLGCTYNHLTSLNVKNGNNNNFSDFRASNNPDLYCVDVDDEAYSTANWTNIDMQTSFSEDCSTLSITDSELADKIVVYPNPTSDIIHIDTKLLLTKVELFDIVGKHIITLKENMKQLNVDHLKAGIYLLTVQSNNGKLTRKIVVE